MSLFLFSTLILSLVYLLVFNSWWIASAPFSIHFTGVLIIGGVLLTILLMMAIFPVLKRQSSSKGKSHLLSSEWSMEVSSRLSTPAAVIEEHTITFTNKAFLIELGMAGMSDQIVGMPLSNVIHPADHHLLANLLANLDDPMKENSILRLICLDGTILPAKFSLSPIEYSTNRILLQFVVASSNPASDISFNEQFNYHLMINRLEEVVFQFQRGHMIEFINPSWEQLSGFSPDESLGKSFLDFVHPEDKPLTSARLDSIAKGKRLRCKEQIRLIRRNGESIWIELRVKNSSAHQNVSANVIGTLTDINEIRQIEANIKSNRHSLNSLLNNVPCMIYRRKADLNLNFEFVSDGCVNITGYGAHEIIVNQSLMFKKLLHPDDKISWDIARNKLHHHEPLQATYRIYSRSGTYQWVMEHGVGIYASTGELLAVEGFIAALDKENDSTFDPDVFRTLQ